MFNSYRDNKFTLSGRGCRLLRMVGGGVLNTTPLKIKEGVILGPILLCINLTYFIRKVTYKLIQPVRTTKHTHQRVFFPYELQW